MKPPPRRNAHWIFIMASISACGSDGGGPTGLDGGDSEVTTEIITSVLPLGVEGMSFEQRLTASGGDGSFSWSIATGSLPPGVSLSAQGVLQGTPTRFGSYGFEVRVQSDGSEATTTLRLSVIERRTISAGGSHTCALEGDAVFCWGANGHGQIDGVPSTPALAPVPTPASGDYALVTAGEDRSCALSIAGEAVCWGSNQGGTLGVGATGDTSLPRPVVGNHTFLKIDAWGRHACGLTVEGIIYCWGSGSFGQTGNGTTVGQVIPVRVVSTKTFVDVAVGQNHSCGLAEDGSTHCWGDNRYGQLGDGTLESESLPVLVSGGFTFTEITAGTAHTCGLDDEGRAYCWGAGLAGQLGAGDAQRGASPTPLPVTGSSRFSRLAAGGAHTCGLGRDDPGVASCWGDNSSGQTGTGLEAPDIPQPEAVSGTLTFLDISSHLGHSCGITASGAVSCWGNNGGGQLGDGTQEDRNVPTSPLILS